MTRKRALDSRWAPTGIAGFDDITGGGLPSGRIRAAPPTPLGRSEAETQQADMELIALSSHRSVQKQKLQLRLFVAGDGPDSVAALRNLRAALAEHPGLAVELDVVDVLKQPELGLRANVLVTPTMIKLGVPFEQRLIGNLKDKQALLALLGVVGLEPG